jgi:hypothetical protein
LKKGAIMIIQKRFTWFALLAIVFAAAVVLPLSNVWADLAPESAEKANGASRDVEKSGISQTSTAKTTPSSPKGALDGKSFLGKMNDPSDSAKSYNEGISFQQGMFHSTACDTFGFGAAAYTTKKAKGVIEFSSTTTSNKDGHAGQMIWHGTVKGNELTAIAQMMVDGKPQRTSNIKATLFNPTSTKDK